MEAFDLRRVDLCSGDPAKQWFLLNSAICGGKPGKFMARCPLVENFPSEFAVIQVADMKDGGLPDRRVCKGEVAFVASLFGVFSAILRKTFKESERDGYIWLMDTINSLQIGIDQQPNPATPTVAQNDKLNVSPPVVSSDLLESIQMENFKLKAELEDAVCRLESLRQEVETFSHSTRSQPEESASDVWTLISDVREKYQLPLASAIADQVHNPEVGKLLSEIAEELTAKKGPKQAFETMLGDSVLHFFQSLRVPDWVLLYFKLQAKIPDQGWQTLLSLTNLGRTGSNTDIPVLLNKNQIKAIRKLIFGIVRKAMCVRPLPDGAPIGFQVSLSAAVAWAARETRLHQPDQEMLEVNLKLDGRPFFGRQQVMIGIVPVNVHHASSESSKSVYPIAIANCKENRENVEALIKDLNAQKNAIKKNGITVDGRHFKVKFTEFHHTCSIGECS